MDKDRAFEQLYNEYYMRVFRYIWKKVGNSDDAEDLTQNSFLYCYQHYAEFDEARASFATWLYLIVNSRIKNFYRDKRSYVRLEEYMDCLPEDPTLNAAIELDEMREQLKEALDRCSPVQKQIVILRYFENQSAKEIGSRLGLTEGNVRTQLSRALTKVEQCCSAAEGF